jgi:hypothetical protein
LNATDDDGDELVYTIPETPANAVYDPGAKLYCWEPTQQQDGEWNLVFRVADGRGGIDIDSVSVTVYTPPVISARHPASDEPLNLQKPNDFQRFTILISYPDPSKLTYEWFVDGIAQNVDDTKFDFHSRDFPQSCYTIKAVVTDGSGADSTEWHGVCITRVQLSSFAGEAEPYMGVRLDWRTSSETDNIGFTVLRSESRNGEYQVISEEVIPSCESGNYTYTDSTAKTSSVYFYKLRDVSTSGLFSDHGPIMVESKLPKQFKILQNYPNPFNPATNIRFELPVPAETRIFIFNISGQMVKKLVQRKLDQGYHQITWDGRNESGIQVSSGVYYYRVIAERFEETRKMVLLR